MASHGPFGHLQHKLWQKERSRVKLPKLGIDPTLVRAGGVRAGGVRAGGVRAGGVRAGGVRAGGVRNTVGKLSRRVTSLLQTSSQSDV